jgi:hypothetical protein
MSIRNSNRMTQVLLLLLVTGVWGLLVKDMSGSAQAQPPATPKNASFDTLTVRRINVVDAKGMQRLVIASPDRMPDAVIRGKHYKRAIGSSAGLIFYDAKGGETGGLQTSTIGGQNQIAMVFDYTHQPTEGIAMGKRESLDGKTWSTGLSISDRRPYHPGPIKSSDGVERVSLQDENHDAALVISDPQGHPRIRLGVDKDGKPYFKTLDEHGKVSHKGFN